MIELAACVCPLTGLKLDEVLWTLPAALAYQFQLVSMQLHGHELLYDRSAKILAQLKRLKA